MKILMVTDDLFSGGAAKHVVELSNELHHRGHTVEIAAGPGDYRKRIDPAIIIYELPIYTANPPHKSISGIASTFFGLRKILKSGSYDIVHSHKRITNALISLASGSRSAVHITSFHNVFYDKHFFTRFGDRSICCSEKVWKVLIEHFGCPESSTVTIHYGINPLKEYSEIEKKGVLQKLGIEQAKTIISSVGLYAPYKDRKNLIRAIYQLKKYDTLKKAMFVIQGYGVEEDEIRTMIAEYNLSESVLLLKKDFSVEALMNISQFLILNSRESEGFPIVILEAASIGKMHIGTKVGGIPEFIDQNKTGMLIPPNDPDSLAETIRSMVENPTEYARMGKKAKDLFFSRFTFDTMVSNIERLYVDAESEKIKNV